MSDEIDLTPEQDSALDRAWKRIEEEDRRKAESARGGSRPPPHRPLPPSKHSKRKGDDPGGK